MHIHMHRAALVQVRKTSSCFLHSFEWLLVICYRLCHFLRHRMLLTLKFPVFPYTSSSCFLSYTDTHYVYILRYIYTYKIHVWALKKEQLSSRCFVFETLKKKTWRLSCYYNSLSYMLLIKEKKSTMKRKTKTETK